MLSSSAACIPHAPKQFGQSFGRNTLFTTTPRIILEFSDNPFGKDVPKHMPSELCLHSPKIMKGYLGNREATCATFTADGWLRTGDDVTLGGIKYSQIHHYLIDWFEKIHPFLNILVIYPTLFGVHLCKKKVFGKVTGF
jgi:hypothetical protein